MVLPSWMSAEGGMSIPTSASIQPPTAFPPNMQMMLQPPPSFPPNIQMRLPPPSFPPNILPMGQMPISMPTAPMISSIQPPANIPPTLSRTQSNQERSIDPSNDVSNWSEHVAPDGRKYWYNKAIAQSTFDKPLVLKTPEERSIPPCKWKEYSTSEGKKYYSDGTTSLWEPPEEYTVWKEKMDQVEQKAKIAASNRETANTNNNTSNNTSTTMSSMNTNIIMSMNNNNQSTNSSDSYVDNSNSMSASMSTNTSNNKVSHKTEVIIPTYDTKEQAVAAFKGLLEEKKVSVTANIKTVTELCQADSRWFALKTSGERKQALTEYQSQRQKVEREVQRTREKRARDSFLMMLAENTDIHSRTRWRDASLLLQDDVRFKNVSDDREREDLFNDFVLELEKKERDDMAKQRTKVLLLLSKIIDNLFDNGVITHKSAWGDVKGQLLQRTQGAEFKVLSESDIRRHLEEFLKKQEAVHREKERLEKEEILRVLSEKKGPFEEDLTRLVREGKLIASSRWRDVLESKDYNIHGLESYQGLVSFGQNKDARALGLGTLVEEAPRDVFDVVIAEVRSEFKADRRLVKDLLYDLQIELQQDTPFSVVSDVVQSMSSGSTGGSKGGVIGVRATAEEGEEVEDTLSRSRDMCGMKLREMITKRPLNLKMIYDEMIEEAVEEFQEEQKRLARKMDRFVELLEEYFYRSDHVGTPWSDAKKSLSKHSAYDDLPKDVRKRLFRQYMADLETKLPTKLKEGGDEGGKKRKFDENS